MPLKLNLQLFAKDGPGGEKTEPASQKKLEDARKKGQVAKSKEIVNAAYLVVIFVFLKLYVGAMGKGFVESFTKFYSSISTGSVSDSTYSFPTIEQLILVIESFK